MPSSVSFAELTDDIVRCATAGIRPGLERTYRLLSLLGDPHEGFKSIHVLGTNGKGSTSAVLESIFRAAGARTALITSPHLVSLSERLTVGGKPLSIDAWRYAFERVREASSSDSELSLIPPTFFEYIITTSFLMAAEAGVDIAVVEAGMGGRYDATSTCRRLATVITPIGMDHTQYLGDTLEAIASEKFAAVRSGVPAFFAGDVDSLSERFLKTCRDVGAVPFILDKISRPTCVSIDMTGTSFELGGQKYFSPLIGIHQAENISRAVLAAQTLEARGYLGESLDMSYNIIKRAVEETVWPGRFEVINRENMPRIILDGAHNPHGMTALVNTVRALPQGAIDIQSIVFAVMRDKDIRPTIDILKQIDRPIFCTSPDTPRAMNPRELGNIVRESGSKVGGVFDDPFDALHAACDITSAGGCVLCCGSLYLIGHLRGGLV